MVFFPLGLGREREGGGVLLMKDSGVLGLPRRSFGDQIIIIDSTVQGARTSTHAKLISGRIVVTTLLISMSKPLISEGTITIFCTVVRKLCILQH